MVADTRGRGALQKGLTPTRAASMRRRLIDLCPDVAAAPQLWDVPAAIDSELAARYAHLELRDRRDWRMGVLCAETPPLP